MAGKLEWINTLVADMSAERNMSPEAQQRVKDYWFRAHPELQSLIDNGTITLGTGKTHQEKGGSTDSNWEVTAWDEGGAPTVDYSKLPGSIVPTGINLPKGTAFLAVNSDNNVDPWTMKPIGPENNGQQVIHDENWGDFQLQDSYKRQKDPWFDLAKMAVITFVTGGIAGAVAPAIASAVGAGGSALAETAIAGAIKAVPAIAQSGGSDRSLVGALASIGGSLTGIPGASTAAKLAANAIYDSRGGS